MKITNLSKAVRGIHDDRGRIHMLAPGQSIEISVSAKQEELLRKKACFKIQAVFVIHGVSQDQLYSGEKLKAAIESALDENTVPQENGVNAIDYLRADAESLGINVDKRWGEKRLQAEIDKALSDAVHTTDSE